jgi:hypothetical protein
MIRLIDPTQTHRFVPTSEHGESDPLRFHVRPMTSRQWAKMAAMVKDTEDGGFDLKFDLVYELLSQNIERIDNAFDNGACETKADIEKFLDACATPEAFGILFDVFRFIQELSTPNEDEAGN